MHSRSGMDLGCSFSLLWCMTTGYETSISRCASERGTHGHNSPVPVDPHGQKILDIYRELQERQVCILVDLHAL